MRATSSGHLAHTGAHRLAALIGIAGILLLGLIVILNPGRVGATHVEPTVPPATNPSCASVGYLFGFKIDAPNEGTYALTNSDGEMTGGAPEDPGNSVTISNIIDGRYFDWTSTLGIDAVLVKGGDNANLYEYSPEEFSDTGLHPPINPNNNMPFGISHIEFCYDYEPPDDPVPLEVSKTVDVATFDRTHNWDITKEADPNLHIGDGTSNYTVNVTYDGFEDSNWQVSGTITITNPNDRPVPTFVSDSINGVGATVTGCGLLNQFVLIPAGGSVQCDYAADSNAGLDGTETENVATALTLNPALDGSVTEPFGYTLGQELNADVTVTDTNPEFGDDVQLSAPIGDTFEYSIDFVCENGSFVHTNTATIVETGQSDNAAVVVICTPQVQVDPLNVTKTVNATYDQDYDWEIEKSVDPDEWNLGAGGSGTSGYTVSVTRIGPENSNYSISGTITIANPNSVAVQVFTVADMIGAVDATVDCGVTFPFELAASGQAGATLECSYAASEADGLDGSETENTVTVTADPVSASGEDTQPISYVVDQVTDETLTVFDTNVDTNGLGWIFEDTGVMTYDVTFTCGESDGRHINLIGANAGDQGVIFDFAIVNATCPEIVDPLSVTKTVDATYDQDYDWEIEKSVDPTELVLPAGGSASAEYTVSVTRTEGDTGNFGVSGTITIINQNEVAVDVLSVVDTLTPSGINAVVDCGVPLPYELASYDGVLGGDDTLVCSYAVSESDGLDGSETENAVTVTTETDVANGSGTQPVAYVVGNVTDETLTVDDTNGMSWDFTDSGVETYELTFECDDDEGLQENTITADGGDQGELSDDANVDVTCQEEEQGTIIIRKQAEPENQPWEFIFQGPGSLSTELLSGESASAALDPGTYVIGEDLTEIEGAWVLSEISCQAGDSTFDADVSAGSATINLVAGDTVDCTFFNEAQPDVVIPESPFAVVFPLIALLVAGAGYLLWRHRASSGHAG